MALCVWSNSPDHTKRVCGPRADPPKIGEVGREKQTNPRLTLDNNYYISSGEISEKYSWQTPHQHEEELSKPGNSSGLPPGSCSLKFVQLDNSVYYLDRNRVNGLLHQN